MSQPLVEGEIIFPLRTHLPRETVIKILLVDSSYVDVPASSVASMELRDVSETVNREGRIGFTIHGRLPDATGTYTVTAHVDTNGDGKINKGDYVNVQSHPVLTHGYPNYVTVGVVQVR